MATNGSCVEWKMRGDRRGNVVTARVLLSFATLLALPTPSDAGLLLRDIDKKIRNVTRGAAIPAADKREISRLVDELEDREKEIAREKSRLRERTNKLEAEKLRLQREKSDLEDAKAVLEDEKRELERTEQLLSFGLLGSGATALLALVGLFVRIPTARLERKLRRLEIREKELSLGMLESSTDAPVS